MTVAYIIIAVILWPVFYRALYLLGTSIHEEWSDGDRVYITCIAVCMSAFWVVFLPIILVVALVIFTCKRGGTTVTRIYNRLER